MHTTHRRPGPAPVSFATPDPAARPRRRRASLVLGAAVLLPAVLMPVAGAAAAPQADPAGPCADPGGVSVVVDASELGGDLAVGCASAPSSGTDALAQAGFGEARDPSGFICAIGGLPDPCPTEFTGSYWSYWFAAPDGEWTTYAEGSDTSAPAAGAVEGWRYGDGSAPPAVAPADVAPGTGSAQAVPDSEAASGAGADAGADPSGATAAPDDDRSLLDGVPEPWRPVAAVAVGLVGVGTLIALIVMLRRFGRRDESD